LAGQIVHADLKNAILAPMTTEAFGDDETRPGIQFRLGNVFADDSSWEINGFWASSLTQEVFHEIGSIDRSANQYVGVGEGPFTDIFKPTQQVFPDLGRLVYEEGVTLTFKSSSWGAEANYYTTPTRSNSALGNIHASFGVRYLGINERFGFKGRDSGFSEIAVIPDGRFFQVSPFTTLVNSELTSNMVGPQIGLKWEIGGKNLKLITEIQGAVAANFEDRKLDASAYGLDNVVSGLGSDIFAGDPDRTSIRQNHVDVAPILAVSVMAEIPIMKWTPVINKVPMFREGIFRFGYDFTQAWNIARPAQSIAWEAPLPRLVENRDHWHVDGFVAGFTWTY